MKKVLRQLFELRSPCTGMLKNHHSLTCCTGCTGVTPQLFIVQYKNRFRQMIGQYLDEAPNSYFNSFPFRHSPVIIVRRMMIRTAQENHIAIILSPLCFLLVTVQSLERFKVGQTPHSNEVTLTGHAERTRTCQQQVTARCLGVVNMVWGWSSFHPADKRKLKEHSCTLFISRVKKKKERETRGTNRTLIGIS